MDLLIKSFICKFYFSLNSFWYQRLLLFRIKSQSGIAFKSFSYQKTCNIILKSSKHEEIIFPHEFIFVFILYFIGGDIVKKMSKVGL